MKNVSTDAIAEMICLAYGENYADKQGKDRESIDRWAHSIVMYMGRGA